MSERILLLTLPSAAMLALLVAHSAVALPRRRAWSFWIACTAYGVARGLAVRAVTERGLGSSFPYIVTDPLFALGGVSLQEVAGWAIVAYLGWWLGHRFAGGVVGGAEPPLHLQVVWAGLWLGAVSLAVETAAVGAGWWQWTLASGGGLLGEVPAIGLVDWSFVAVDFLWPFVVLTATKRFWGLVLLAAFPLHFASHLAVDRISEIVPVPWFHAVHWLLAAMLVAAALLRPERDRGFVEPASVRRRFPVAALMLLAIALAATLVVAGRLDRLSSLAPASLVAVIALDRRRGAWVAGAVAAGGVLEPALLLAAVPAAASLVLVAAHGRGRLATTGVVATLLAAALLVHDAARDRERRLTRKLEEALAARDRGELARALESLEQINREPPYSHAAHGLRGEILYRSGRLDEARDAFEAAVGVKRAFPMALRHLVVIDLRSGNVERARRRAEKALALAPQDVELRYLGYRAAGHPPPADFWETLVDGGAAAVETVAGLAFEVDDVQSARHAAGLGAARWPERPSLHDIRFRLALAGGDTAGARDAVNDWLEALPDDPSAHRHAAALEAAGAR